MGPAAGFGLRVATTAVLLAVEPPPVVVVEQTAPPPVYLLVGDTRSPEAEVVAPRPERAPLLPGFDAVAAHSAIDAVDTSSCWSGAKGHGTTRVTFSSEGTVDSVEVVSPVEGAHVDTSCMTAKYESVSVQPFAGKPVAVRATFYVG
jgi:hypothetical protein